MYDNIVKGNHVPYKAPGTAVQNVYNPSLSRDQNIANMTAEIYRQGPSNVSKHCADFNQINVVDISLSNVSSDQLADLKNKGLINSYIVEDDCYHIVIGQ